MSTPKFDRTCNGLKGRIIKLNSADMRTDLFTHIKREITEYVGKEYTNSRDV